MNIIVPKRYTPPRFQSWVSMLDFLTQADSYTVASLVGDLGVVGQMRKNPDASLSPIEWFDLRLAPQALLTEMFSAVTGLAPTPQTPHASSGGLVIGVATDTQSSIGLNNLAFDGSSRVMEAEFIWDAVDEPSIAVGGGFGAGFRPTGVAVTGAALRGAGATKSASGVLRPSYIFNSLNGFSVTIGAQIAGAALPAGTKLLTTYACFQNGNLASGIGDAGADLATVSYAGQTAGTGIATPNNTTVHTDKIDLQAIFCNFGLDGTNLLRLIRFKISGFGVKV